MVKMTDSMKLEVVKMWNNRATLKQIAENFNMSQAGIQKILKQLGFTIGQRKTPREIAVYIQGRLSNGETLKDIGDSLGITESAVHRRISRAKARGDI